MSDVRFSNTMRRIRASKLRLGLALGIGAFAAVCLSWYQNARVHWGEIRVVGRLGEIPQIGDSLDDWNTVGKVRYRHKRSYRLDEYFVTGYSDESAISDYDEAFPRFHVHKDCWNEPVVKLIAEALEVESAGSPSMCENGWILGGFLSDGAQILGVYSPSSKKFWICTIKERSSS